MHGAWYRPGLHRVRSGNREPVTAAHQTKGDQIRALSDTSTVRGAPG